MAKGKERTESERRAYYVGLLCDVTADTRKGIKRICDELRKEDPSFPAARTMRDWFAEDKALAAQYARAKEEQLEQLAEEIIEISDDSTLDMDTNDEGKTYVNTEHIQRSKLRVDSRKWILSKLKPKTYGDRITQEVTGEGGGPVVVKIEI